jgi:hypothetical protein
MGPSSRISRTEANFTHTNFTQSLAAFYKYDDQHTFSKINNRAEDQVLYSYIQRKDWQSMKHADGENSDLHSVSAPTVA